MDAEGTSLSDTGDDRTTTPVVDPGRFRRSKRLVHGFVYVAGVAAILTAAFILTPISGSIYFAMDAHDDLAEADFIICLGGDSGRVVESAKLLQEGFAPLLIVTNHGGAAQRMRDQAIEWGAGPDQVLVDETSTRTKDHPEAVGSLASIDRANDTCIIVTSYTHLRRARAVFEKAGYRKIIMREPRWERQTRNWDGMSWRGRFLVFPKMVYEGAGWILYWASGYV